MLTRPLVYKGPTDHLSQHFMPQTLYQGMGLLLADALIDWQKEASEPVVRGVFYLDGQVIKTQMDWPIKQVSEETHCSCWTTSANKDEMCVHLGALAIESKTRLDRLPSPVKQQEPFETEVDYLASWRKKQRFDPFPNMARHRVVYLIKGEPGAFYLEVNKAYLTKTGEYQLKASLGLDMSMTEKLPKFVSLSDQQILIEIQKILADRRHLQLKENQLSLQGANMKALLQLVVSSGRCFWGATHRQAMQWRQTVRVDESCSPVAENIFLCRTKSQLVEVVENAGEDDLINGVRNFEKQNGQIIPTLVISSELVGFSWRNNASDEFDMATPGFYFTDEAANRSGKAFSMASLDKLQQLLPDLPGLTKVMEKCSAYLHQIDTIDGLRAFFEPPISELFDPYGRVFDGDFCHWFPLLRGLQLEGWDIEFNDSFRFNLQRIEQWYSTVAPSQNVLAGADGETDSWFDLEVGVKVNGEAVNLLPVIVESLRLGKLKLDTEKRFIPLTLADGRVISIERERVSAIVDTLVELAEKHPLKRQKLRLPATQLTRVNLLEKQTHQKVKWLDAKALQTKAEALAKQEKITSVAIPASINATLRAYQKTGVSWLQFLSEHQLGGILADDMGLGKTLQTLVHIQIEKDQGRMRGPTMVIAPTSLLGNWINEAKKFTPGLKRIHWAGAKRHQHKSQLAKADLIITSYGVLLRDAHVFDALPLHLLVLDEAQAIKNSRNRVSKIAFTLRSRLRLCLTGTPLENNLGELWSLFHFLMPGLLGEQAQFKRLFQQPIEKHQDMQRQQQLAERVAPFMLRRTKDKVAADLPRKTEIVERIELSQKQADVYESVRMSMLEEVQKVIANQSSGNQILIGNALLRLRQICCDPRLVDLEQAKAADSAKLNWLETTLPEMIDNGRSILIFSSFTSMLKLIAKLLQQLKIPFLTLTGQSRHREQLVERFQAGEVPVFLISLKAGGAGLNLTRADTVIHYDPWWNPAAENQASDRVHRIGQDKPVFIYKLISQGTVEERIQGLQTYKSKLANDLYQQNETLRSINKIDWQQLLAPLEEY